MSHRWTEVEGATYCATCGVPKAKESIDCRQVAVEPPKEQANADALDGLALAESIFGTIAPRSESEIAEYRFQNDTLPRLRDAGFSDRHRKRIGDWNCAPQQAVFSRCLQLCVGSGAIVALTGERGTGKTTICAQLAISRAENESLAPWNRQPPYRKLQSLVERYKPLYGNMGSVEMDALATARDWYCQNPSLAFIDEVHECEDLAIKNRLLTDILDRRYSAKRDTILISNQSVEDFKKSVGDSILSRLSEHGSIIPCNWKSWRAKAA